MSYDNNGNEFSTRLTSLWNEGNKDIALEFLRRATTMDMTLQDLAQALQFKEVQQFISEFTLDEILPHRTMISSATAHQPEPSAAQPERPSRQLASIKIRRKRRTSDEIAALRDALLLRLQSAVGSVTTSHLRDVLTNGGHDVDLLQLGRMLSALEEEGYITCLGGKPKAWRVKPQGRRAPEPLVIRKAQDVAMKDDFAAG